MFTIADIRNIAIQIERNGENSYRKAADAAKDAELAAVFSRMADEEKRHAEWFASLEEARELSEEQRELEAVGKSILQEMVEDRTFSLEEGELGAIDNIADVLTKSQEFERDTILFYEMLSGFIENEQTLEQLGVIIDEEKRHQQELEELLGSTAASAE